MAIQHYDGILGEFDYDDEEFKLERGTGEFSAFLHYTGKETDGSKIHIPEGIVDCNHMFYNCDFLKTPPVISNGVKDCYGMFHDCHKLKVAPKILEGVEDCSHMFSGCNSLEVPPEMPNSVNNCDHMFSCCHNLKTPSVIPDGVTNCEYMFFSCYSLETAPAIPESVENCNFMFDNCKSLKTSPMIPNSVKDCYCMFCSCKSLETAPAIPDSVEDCSYMFDECSDEIQKIGKWNIEHRGQSYKNILDEYGLSDVSKDFDLSMKMDIADLCIKCKDSNSCYNQILDDIKDGFITDSELLKQEIEAMDKCIEQMKIDERKKQASNLLFDDDISISEEEVPICD